MLEKVKQIDSPYLISRQCGLNWTCLDSISHVNFTPVSKVQTTTLTFSVTE